MTVFDASKKEIRISKTPTELDKFCLDVIKIISKYTDYVIISGYVSIFFGRARATEDIDFFIKPVDFSDFKKMLEEFAEKDYELTANNAKELYTDYLKKNLPISIWKKDFPLLRAEVKMALKDSQKLQFNDRIKAVFSGKELYFSSIESQIAYKRFIAKSEKDMEDARHLEVVFKNIDRNKISYYKKIFEREFK